jgi:hypothetical protein
MKKVHIPTLKFHTIYSLVLLAVFLVTIIIVRDLSLGLVGAVLVAYVIGNGIIHGQKNEITRDAILEYILVSLIVVVVFLGVFFTR